jgi:hypothetical protein
MKSKSTSKVKRAGVAVDALVRLTKMHAVYVREDGKEWTIFSGEPDLASAKVTASMLEVTNPNSDVCIVPPNEAITNKGSQDER